MTAERVFTVARKEFADQITGWRYLVVLALFLAIALAGTYSGVGSYERELDRYSQQLAMMDDRFDESERMTVPSKPPIEGIYSSMFLTLISYGGLLVFSVVPSPGDLWMILTYAGVTLLFLVTFFSIALAFSTFCRESGSALLLAVVVFILLSFVIPFTATHIGAALMMEEPDPAAYGGDTSSEGYQAEITAYYEQQDVITSATNLFSPGRAINNLIQRIHNSPSSGAALEDTLGEIWSSVVALIFYPVGFFAAAYTRFMRMDIQ